MQLAAVMRVCPECRASSHSVLPKKCTCRNCARCESCQVPSFYCFQGCKVGHTIHAILCLFGDPGGRPFSCGPRSDHCLMRGACDWCTLAEGSKLGIESWESSNNECAASLISLHYRFFYHSHSQLVLVIIMILVAIVANTIIVFVIFAAIASFIIIIVTIDCFHASVCLLFFSLASCCKLLHPGPWGRSSGEPVQCVTAGWVSQVYCWLLEFTPCTNRVETTFHVTVAHFAWIRKMGMGQRERALALLMPSSTDLVLAEKGLMEWLRRMLWWWYTCPTSRAHRSPLRSLDCRASNKVTNEDVQTTLTDPNSHFP